MLGEVAAAVYGNPSERLRVIGVTGTSGKTTTTYLIEAGLRAAGRVAGLIGTVGVRIDGRDQPSGLTTPEAPELQALLAAMVEQGVDTVVMEVSSHALTLGRVDGVSFAVGGFTNLSRDHLDFHASMAGLLRGQGAAVRPGVADARGAVGGLRRRRVGPRDGRARAPGGDGERDRNARTGPSKTSLPARAVSRTSSRWIPPVSITICGSGCPGGYNVANGLLAVALLDAAGVSPEQAAPGLRDATVPGRLEAVDRGQPFLALVDYAHKPGALRAVLQTLREQATGRLAVVFGAGGNRDQGKREPMGQVAAELADLVVVTDDNPRDEDPAVVRAAIIAGTATGGADVVEIGDRRAAIDHAVAWARAGDIVVIAGKGHEAGQTSRGQTRPFDDRDELAERPGGAELAGVAHVIELSLAQIAEIVGGRLADITADEAAATRVTGTVEFDSRAVTPGGLFLALPGARSDGHDFAAAAVAAGAVAVLAARPVGVPAIIVDPVDPGSDSGGTAGVLEHDTDGSGAAVLAALAKLAAAVAAELVAGGLTIVGITGSSGKTSTKDLIAAVLAPLGEVIAPPGSFNNELGHPWTVLRATRSTDYLVLEMSARHPGNIAALAAIAPPSIAAVLNVGTAHLGEFGSREAIAATKAELPQAVPASGVVILNVDDPVVAAMADKTAARVVRVGRSSDAGAADVRADNVILDPLARAGFTLHAGGAEVDVSLAVHGDHQVSNALCAAAVALECGAGLDQVAAALGAAGPVSRQRMQVSTRGDGVTIINDAYNANPDSMRAGLKALAWMGRQAPPGQPQLGGAGRDGRARRRRDIRA